MFAYKFDSSESPSLVCVDVNRLKNTFKHALLPNVAVKPLL